MYVGLTLKQDFQYNLFRPGSVWVKVLLEFKSGTAPSSEEFKTALIEALIEAAS